MDVLEVELAMVGRQAFLLVLELGLALDKVPLQTWLGHLVLGVERASDNLVVVSSHFVSIFTGVSLKFDFII